MGAAFLFGDKGLAHSVEVILSVNLDGDQVCVDVFRRRDGSYGFDEFRRDPEDGRGWYSIGYHGGLRFGSYEAALAAAEAAVGWFERPN